MYYSGIIIGLLAGFLSGMVGIGGGIVMIPSLIFLLGYDQHIAQGTVLAAMLPPIGILAVHQYFSRGFVKVPVAIMLALGFFAGGYIGGKISVNIDGAVLRKIFGFSLLFISIGIILKK